MANDSEKKKTGKGAISDKERAKKANKYIDVSPQLAEEEIEEALSVQQRRARARSFRKNKARVKMGSNRAARRRATMDTLKARALRRARGMLKKKLAGGKNYNDLSVSQKVSIDKRAEKISKTRLDMLARRALRQTRQDEIDRLKARNMSAEDKKKAAQKNESVNELFEARTSTDGTTPVRYHQLLNKDHSVKTDRRFKMFKQPAMSKPEDREWGTDSLTAVYSALTPGEGDSPANDLSQAGAHFENFNVTEASIHVDELKKTVQKVKTDWQNTGGHPDHHLKKHNVPSHLEKIVLHGASHGTNTLGFREHLNKLKKSGHVHESEAASLETAVESFMSEYNAVRSHLIEGAELKEDIRNKIIARRKEELLKMSFKLIADIIKAKPNTSLEAAASDVVLAIDTGMSARELARLYRETK